MPRLRRLLIAATAIVLPFAALVLAVEGYYAYVMLTEPIRTSGSFGRMDGELGWTLQPNAAARLSMTNRFTNETYFDSRIYTDSLGFRAAANGNTPQPGSVIAVGDSWTFGYAVDYEQSFPGHLENILGAAVTNMAVPAYGTAQSLLLLERHVAALRPRVVIHLNLSLWQRALCHGQERPRQILKPCFWLDPASQQVEIVTPPANHVDAMAARGIYPGGWLTAGGATWGYYLISRPIIKLQQLFTAAGLMPGHRSEFDGDPVLGPAALSYALTRFAANARTHGFHFVLIDPAEDYRQAYGRLAPGDKAVVLYLGAAEWQEEVVEPSAALAEPERIIPKDGHYGPGMNRLIAQFLSRQLAALPGWRQP